MSNTISIANLPTWTPSTDDILVFVDRADWVTKRANQDEFPSSWTGDVTWPASSTDNALARMDWTTGKVIQNSTVTLSDTGDIAGVNEIQVVELRASTSAWVDVHNNSGTQIAIFGAGWSTWSTLVGTTNVGSASADYHQLSGGTGTITDTATWSSTNININVVPKWTGRFQAGWVNVPTVSSTDTLTNKDISSATNTYRSASDTVTGAVELATIAETNTGTDATRALTPDGLAGSNFGISYVACSLNGTTALTTSDKAYFRIPPAFTGMNLITVRATVGTGASGSSSSGIPTFTVKNVTDGNQMLSTNLTVDASEYTSATAATPAVINTSFDDVVTDDLIEVACTVAGTGVTYATITLWFQLP